MREQDNDRLNKIKQLESQLAAYKNDPNNKENQPANTPTDPLLKLMDNDESKKLLVKLAEQKLKHSYNFNETFDGTAGENALKFRREMNDYYHTIKTKLGIYFDEHLALQNIIRRDRPQLLIGGWYDWNYTQL